MRLYKYFNDADFAIRFVERGELMFSTLSYFRDLEGDEARGDPFEGNLRHRPDDGLQLNMQDGRTVRLPDHEMRSRVDQSSIFVSCFSTELNDDLKRDFDATHVVEIESSIRVVSKVRQRLRLRSRFDRQQVFHGLVDYRDLAQAPIIDWALPEKIAFIKSVHFSQQCEFRIVVGQKGAFDPQNVEMLIAPVSQVPELHADDPDRLLFKLGDLRAFATLRSI